MAQPRSDHALNGHTMRQRPAPLQPKVWVHGARPMRFGLDPQQMTCSSPVCLSSIHPTQQRRVTAILDLHPHPAPQLPAVQQHTSGRHPKQFRQLRRLRSTQDLQQRGDGSHHPKPRRGKMLATWEQRLRGIGNKKQMPVTRVWLPRSIGSKRSCVSWRAACSPTGG